MGSDRDERSRWHQLVVFGDASRFGDIFFKPFAKDEILAVLCLRFFAVFRALPSIRSSPALNVIFLSYEKSVHQDSVNSEMMSAPKIGVFDSGFRWPHRT